MTSLKQQQQIKQTLFGLFFFASTMVNAEHLVQPDSTFLQLDPDMKCLNNGVARFITKDPHSIQMKMQSGKMTQECICPMGYRGMTCEVDEEAHDACKYDPSSQECDCAVADERSPFAGRQCRRPFTQYCASLKNSVGGHISFCTNSGKCKGDLMAAKYSPGDTTQNYVFQHAGCICPKEFTGPHCEVPNEVYHETIHHAAVTTKSPRHNVEVGTLFSFLVFGVAIAVFSFILIRKVRGQRRSVARLRGLPQLPPELTMTRYRDDQFGHDVDDDDDDDGLVYANPLNEKNSVGSGGSDDEYRDALPEIA